MLYHNYCESDEIMFSHSNVVQSYCERQVDNCFHSAAGWGMGGSVIAAACGVQSPFVRAMGCHYLRCATYVIAGQYATSHCKPLLVMFM